MRHRLAIVALGSWIVLLLVAPNLAAATTDHPGPAAPPPLHVPGHSVHAATSPWSASELPATVPWSVRPDLNMTLAPGPSAPFAPLASSVASVEAPPSVPDTTPTVVTLATDLKNCCLNQTFDLPNGTWSRIVLTYVGTVVNGVYDSSYRAYVDKVPVLFGTSPEYGTWTVRKDVTEYSTLLRGSATIQFFLGAATLAGGYFLANLTLSFYPVPAGGTAPQVPNELIPLWNAGPGQSAASPSESQTVSLPPDVVNATMEVFTYGFNPSGDEFWYDAAPAFRSVTVTSNSTPIATLYPFPFINTGGSDLFLWRPVTAVATVDNPPQHFDVSAWLPFLEGPHTLTATFTGIGTAPANNWLCRGSLLLYTDPNVTGASLQSESHQITVGPARAVGGTIQQVGRANYSASTLVTSTNGVYYLNATVSQLFSSNITTTTASSESWDNVSMDSRTVGSTVESGANGTTFVNHSFDAPFRVDMGGEQKEIATTNGSYPIYIAFNNSFLNGIQVWNESTLTTSPGGPGQEGTSVLDELAGADGVFGGVDEIQTSGGAPVIISVSGVSTSAPREYSLTSTSAGLQSSYVHVVVASGVDPPGPNYAATVVTNTLTAPLAAGGSVSRSEVEVGETTVFYVRILGGLGVPTITWSGLPSGCRSANTTALSCTPDAAGTYTVQASLFDGVGDAASFEVASVLVLPAPTVAIATSSPGIDLGGSISLNATVSGGSAPFNCTWRVDGAVDGPARSCQQPFSLTATGGSQISVNVSVTDALGAVGHSLNRSFAVAGPITDVLENGSRPALSTLRAVEGSVVPLGILVGGGTAPYTVVWYSGGVAFSSGWTANLTVGKAGSTQTVYALITDSGGGANQSATLTVTSLAPATPTTNSGGGPSPAGGSWEDLAILALIMAAVLGGGLAYVLLRPRLPPRND
ncbi:MAG TPA: peptide-N4-asparagine amidase [Thermoplasmata archaeon]|nr:peptide-N4-asparagine amidase [Thermoplasmata archaeon]